MFPLHCIIETVSLQECINCCSSDQKQIVLDSYAIIAGDTKLRDLVNTVLDAVGLHDLVSTAKGKICLNNWKPLSFDEITDDDEMAVDLLFKDLSNHITLTIIAKRMSSAPNSIAAEQPVPYMEEAKGALLRVAASQLPNLLDTIDDQEIKDFAEELLQDDTDASRSAHDPIIAEKLIQWCSHQTRPVDPGRVSSAVTTTKFNHFLEVPKLERWFTDNPNPSRSRMLQFMHILNSSNFRKHTQKISFQQMSTWFSTMRAAQRKQCGIVPKVFSNNVRNTSLDFNSFLQLSSRTSTSPCPPSSSGSTFVQFPSSGSFTVGKTGGASIMNRHKYTRPSKIRISPGDNETAGLPDDFNATYIGLQDAESQKMDVQGFDIGHIQPGTTYGSPANIESVEPEVSSLTSETSIVPSPDNAIAATPSPGSTPGCSDSSNVKSEPSDMVDESMGMVSSASPATESIKREDEEEEVADSSLSGLYDGAHPRGSMVTEASAIAMLAGANSPPKIEAIDTTLSDVKPNAAAVLSAASGHRTRLMFDPLSEIPILEKWFDENPHPSWLQIEQFTETLNAMAYRQTYPPITTYNVKIWFKNRRAKNKRLTLNSGNSLLGPTSTDFLVIPGEGFAP